MPREKKEIGKLCLLASTWLNVGWSYCEATSQMCLSGEYVVLAHLWWYKEWKEISPFFSSFAMCCPEHFTVIMSLWYYFLSYKTKPKRSVKASFTYGYSSKYHPHKCLKNLYFLWSVCNTSSPNHAISIKLCLRIWMFIQENFFSPLRKGSEVCF